MNYAPKDKIWMLIHGELDDEAEVQLLAEISADEDLTRAFYDRSELDLVLGEVLGREDALARESADGPQGGPPVTGDNVIPLHFPFLLRLSKIAAVIAVLLALVLVLIPHGDVRWHSTQVVLLDHSRGDTQSGQDGVLDVSEVKRVCENLKRTISNTYDAAGTRTPRDPWMMTLSVSEQASGAFEIRIEGRPENSREFALMEARRYDSASSFEADVPAFATVIVRSMRHDER